ncbi:hypothetical protein JVU11DRAFT_11014 [Chiua virens]|nr:hypothetical protein JVU11DRAFT_11014 [Chiua virens]
MAPDMDGVPPQHIYATNLRQNIGYPLRDPKPDEERGNPYIDQGFQVGDVGWVKDNATNSLNESIKRSQRDIRVSQGLDPDTVIMGGVTHMSGDPSVEGGYKFTATSTSGAMLILPNGAIVSELKEKYLEDLRELAIKSVLPWCKYAKRDALYLVTTVYTTKAWTLGAFYNGFLGGNITVCHRPPDDTHKYKWLYPFNVDHRQSPKDNRDINQTVFIKGFKMTVRWKWLPVVQELHKTERRFARVLATLRSIMRSREWLFRKDIQHFPPQTLTQPHHALDIINRVLLDKNPEADVAVAHDNDWIEMFDKKELSLENLMNENALRDIIEQKYTANSNSNNKVVYLRRNQERAGDERGSAGDPSEGTGADREDVPRFEDNKSANDDCETRDLEDTSPLPSSNDSRLVITNIRLESFDVEPIDAGVCVILQSDMMVRRTKNKPHAEIIEWEEEIVLPTDPEVNVVVCGVFQLSSTLGTREIATRQIVNTASLTSGIHKLRLPLGSAGSYSSLLITLGRLFSGDEPQSSHHEMSKFEDKTTRGFNALYAHRDEPEGGYLEVAVECFRSAVDECDPHSPDRITALFNLASSEFIRCHANGTYSELSSPIKLYRELEVHPLLNFDHPDRPATLLLLAQALLFCYGQSYDESVVREIEPLLAEIHHDGSRKRQTADAILHTCRFYDAIQSGDLNKVDELFRDLERGAYVPPYGYFDYPHMLHELGAALWRRFQLQANLDDLDKSIGLNEEALRLTPDGHHDHPSIVDCLGNSYLRRIQARGDLTDVDMSVSLTHLGEMVIAKLDELTSGEGIGVPLETLREQIEQISASDSAARSLRSLGPTGRIPQIRIPIEEWNKEDGTPKKCTRQLGVLLSFLRGEGEARMRKLLGNLEWPFKDRMIEDTAHFLKDHIPYFDSIVEIKLRCLMGGWCVTEHLY